jgi:hypothetical protein
VTRAESCLVLLAFLFAGLAGVGWYAGVPSRVTPAGVTVSHVIDVSVPLAESIDAASRIVVVSDPFRFERRPSAVAYRPDLEGVMPLPKPPKPALILEGLVGNAALLDGAPGRGATAIVRAGDSVGGLRVRRIDRDTVIVIGADTTWRLTVRRAWQ